MRENAGERGAQIRERVRVRAHECVLDEFIASIDLLRCVALIVVPDPTTAPGHHAPNAEQSGHLTWLENAPLWIDERNAVTLEFESGGEVGGVEYATAHSGEPINVAECGLSELGVYA